MNDSVIEVSHEWAIPFLHTYSDFFVVSKPIIFATWIIIAFILFFIIAFKYLFHKKNGKFRFVILSAGENFIDLCSQTMGQFSYKHFTFITSLFIFILFCNFVGLIPFVEEPTADINTPLALGVFSFLYTNFYAIRTHGFLGFIKEFFEPFFLMFPLNVIGHLAGIVSISFRLFGNIFGGATLTGLYVSAATAHPIAAVLVTLSGLNIVMTIFFGVFEGLIQAFVFTILTMTQLSIAIQTDED